MKQKFLIIGVIEVFLLLSLFSFLYLYKHPRIPSSTSVDLKNVVIKMRRGACFGACPVYSLTIYGDGRVLYEGEKFVTVTGKQQDTISQNKVQELVNEFYKIDYFSLKDRYWANVTDLPTTTTSITIDGRTKKVVDYYGAPQALIELENKIDETTNSHRWISAGRSPTFPVIENQPETSPTAEDTDEQGTKNVQIFLVVLEDNGKNGKKIGCNDSLVPVGRVISSAGDPVKAALDDLFSIRERLYGESGLYNSLYNSSLEVDSISVESGKAIVNLSGNVLLGGVCDNPRFEEQIIQTALQVPSINEVSVFINGVALEEVLSLK